MRQEGVDWINLAQDRDQWRALVKTVMNLQFPWRADNLLTSWAYVSFSRRALLHGIKEFLSSSLRLKHLKERSFVSSSPSTSHSGFHQVARMMDSLILDSFSPFTFTKITTTHRPARDSGSKRSTGTQHAKQKTGPVRAQHAPEQGTGLSACAISLAANLSVSAKFM
jgi:hypothetical protein